MTAPTRTVVVELTVNGVRHRVYTEARRLLVHVLRDLGYRSVRVGCDTANCGACTVILDGRPVKSCNLLAVQADGAEIYTLEHSDDLLDKVKQAFHRNHALQCGYCTSGMVLTAYSLLRARKPKDEAEIREYMSGVLCRCTGYQNIVKAVKEAAGI